MRISVEGLSNSEIARQLGRTRETVGLQLRGEDYDKLQRDLDAETAEEARLRRSRLKAAAKWDEAMDVAATKGHHEPMRDLLRRRT